jgi:hypothetical protein
MKLPRGVTITTERIRDPWLDYPPLDTDMSALALEAECLERWKFLLSRYKIPNTLEGWRELAILAVLDCSGAFYPLYRYEPRRTGRPRDRQVYFIREALVDFTNKMKAAAAKEGKPTHRLGSKAVIAFRKQLENPKAKIRGIPADYRVRKIGTLRNLLKKTVPVPAFIKYVEADEKIATAVRKAALRLPK